MTLLSVISNLTVTSNLVVPITSKNASDANSCMPGTIAINYLKTSQRQRLLHLENLTFTPNYTGTISLIIDTVANFGQPTNGYSFFDYVLITAGVAGTARGFFEVQGLNLLLSLYADISSANFNSALSYQIVSQDIDVQVI